MKILTKLSALVLAAALALGCLCACGAKEDPAELLSAAEAKLEGAAYSAKITTSLSARDAKLQERIDAVGTPDVTLTYSTDAFKLRTSITLDDMRLISTYTATGGVLYLESLAAIGDETLVSKQKAALDVTELRATVAALGAGAELGYDDFENAEVSASIGKTTVKLSGIKAASLSSIEGIISSPLGADTKMTLTDVAYAVEITGGAYSKTTVTYTYSVDMDGVLYNMTGEVVTEYTYDDVKEIVAPADADMYENAAYSDIVR